MSYQNILVFKEDKIGIIKFNRPKSLNALSKELMKEVADAVEKFEQDKDIRIIILTGNERAFAAGADLLEFNKKTPNEMFENYRFLEWERVYKCYKPLIASVSGYALGGGFELAMICDMIVASDSAVFGQPEINVGLMPGAGGTQRLTKLIQKQRAMEYILSGKYIDVWTAYKLGIVNKIVPTEIYLEMTIKFARQFLDKPPISLNIAKDSIKMSYELNLQDGLEYERKMFYYLFSTKDALEGISAFLEKRTPKYIGE
ncbi:MAG: enoyl-CoA hydratase-related protein [candidate division WOR-3 bacterium]|nr:enoyl-CoA hydratase-related protein [candidate division WOR-3 bacterium]MCX7947799.1 enoyl-CoA hydratase-related protein [candidate division WOR-3 bacterium]MDW8150756.1 enoyl-CoA hydratase-related protein [candidate division WOR-3 bacterium]